VFHVTGVQTCALPICSMGNTSGQASFSTDYAERFGGVARLVGRAGLERLQGAHVCVVGVGGVGSWVAEGLARSGVGALTLVDLGDRKSVVQGGRVAVQ